MYELQLLRVLKEQSPVSFRLHELSLHRQHRTYIALCQYNENFFLSFFLAQTCGSRGYYSICRGQYSPSGVIVIPNRDTMTPFRLPSLAYIKPVKQCAGILRTTKKNPLSTKRSIEVWNLMKQRQSTGDTPQSPSEMRSIPSLLTLQHIKLIKLCVDPNEGSKKKNLSTKKCGSRNRFQRAAFDKSQLRTSLSLFGNRTSLPRLPFGIHRNSIETCRYSENRKHLAQS